MKSRFVESAFVYLLFPIESYLHNAFSHTLITPANNYAIRGLGKMGRLRLCCWEQGGLLALLRTLV